ncbi:TylF/MycF/NovP-related O-methyltransferase [Streptomyces xiangluensis]|uniref:TylF/MycF/NovP-related O-methyltransferase n=1 Tax=Streptomyces xiangluensis TaxID=2665720 RepID=A0ABV8Z4N5_9ACTN
MTWRRNVNDTLRRLSGYELRRSRPASSRESSPQSVPQRPSQRPQQSSEPSPGRKFPADYDDDAKEVIRAVSPYTMTSPERLNALILAARYVSRHNIAGDIVECGVWRGGSMQAAARTLLGLHDTGRHLYLFDTFEGMPAPTDKDLRRDGESAADLLARQDRSRPIWAVATLEDVKEGFERIPYPADRVHFVQGLVEDTIPAAAPEQISILRLDTDWYASTRHELEHLYPRLVSGGVLLIDDYGWWQGSKAAVDEFLEKTGARLLLLRMDEGRIAVKP